MSNPEAVGRHFVFDGDQQNAWEYGFYAGPVFRCNWTTGTSLPNIVDVLEKAPLYGAELDGLVPLPHVGTKDGFLVIILFKLQSIADLTVWLGIMPKLYPKLKFSRFYFQREMETKTRMEVCVHLDEGWDCY